jgi:hypothetical protein
MMTEPKAIDFGKQFDILLTLAYDQIQKTANMVQRSDYNI